MREELTATPYSSPGSSVWGSSETLLLEGLSRLNERLTSATDSPAAGAEDSPAEKRAASTISNGNGRISNGNGRLGSARSVRRVSLSASSGEGTDLDSDDDPEIVSPFRLIEEREASPVRAGKATAPSTVSAARHRLSQRFMETAPSDPSTKEAEEEGPSPRSERLAMDSIPLVSKPVRAPSPEAECRKSTPETFAPPSIRPFETNPEAAPVDDDNSIEQRGVSREESAQGRRRSPRDRSRASESAALSEGSRTTRGFDETAKALASAKLAWVIGDEEESRRPASTPPAPSAKPRQTQPSTNQTITPPAVREMSPPDDEEAPKRPLPPALETAIRRRRARSSFLLAVMTALLLTTLVWGVLLVTSWAFLGDEWFSNRVQEETTAFETRVRNDLRVARAELGEAVHTAQEQVVLLRARHDQFVRINALEAAMYADHSRQKFDDLLDIGSRLETGSPEEEFFKQTKERIETAYSRRLQQHAGLEVRALFPQLRLTKETSLGKANLLKLLTRTNTAGWDRARAAFLLRRYVDDEEVIAQLVQTVRDEEDLQVVFAAWETLVTLTGFEPGSKDFSPSDFDRWWSTRIS